MASVLDIIDCMEHMQQDGIKEAKYIVLEMMKIMLTHYPTKSCFKQILFDGGATVQKMGLIMKSYFPQTWVIHRMKHVVSLIVATLFFSQDFENLQSLQRWLVKM